MNNLKVFFLISVSLVFLLSFIPFNISVNNELFKMEPIQQDSIRWIAPDSANKLVNPFEMNDDNFAKGLPIYKKLCRSCHGRLGDGQGVEAEDLETVTTDFTNSSFLEQTDGSMLWKISEGRDDMESFKEKLKEEDIWLVVLYIKTFSAASKE